MNTTDIEDTEYTGLKAMNAGDARQILSQVKALLAKELAQVEGVILEQFGSEVRLIAEAALPLVLSGGKRIRPLVLLLTAKALGYEGLEDCLLAATVELIHTATLLHDDVVDNANLRRNIETANAVWGNKPAILIGDFLYSQSFLLMLKTKRLEILEILAAASNVIAEGEILQWVQERNPEATEEAYIRIIEKKTAKLFEAAAELPAVFAEQPECRSSLKAYGRALGLVFQIVDDILDYQSSVEVLGKPRHADLFSGKPTLPLIYLLKTGTADEKALALEAIQGNLDNAGGLALEDLFKALEGGGALDYSWTLARKYANLAVESLSDLPDTVYKTALLQLVDLALYRDH
ncbi:MAG: polyprenyl synthetase family protein [Gammaproteobacteria bacterium]